MLSLSACPLDNRSIRRSGLKARFVRLGKDSEGHKLVPAQVVPIAFGKPVDEKRRFIPPKQHDRAEPAGSAASLPGDALLDNAAEIGIDQAPRDAAGRSGKRRCVGLRPGREL